MKTKGISFIEGLQLLFLYCHFAGLITWPWWCVVSPIIIKWGLTWFIGTLERMEKNRAKDGKQ